MSLTPNLQWYQNTTHVFIEVLISDAKDVNIIFQKEEKESDNGIISMNMKKGKQEYIIEFEWFGKIVSAFSSFEVKDNKIICLIKKEEDISEAQWTRLTKIKDLYKNSIKVNWDKFDDGEEDTVPEEYGDMMQRMQQMHKLGASGGGMGGESGGMDMQKMMQEMQMMQMMEQMKGMGGENGEEGMDMQKMMEMMGGGMGGNGGGMDMQKMMEMMGGGMGEEDEEDEEEGEDDEEEDEEDEEYEEDEEEEESA